MRSYFSRFNNSDAPHYGAAQVNPTAGNNFKSMLPGNFENPYFFNELNTLDTTGFLSRQYGHMSSSQNPHSETQNRSEEVRGTVKKRRKWNRAVFR